MKTIKSFLFPALFLLLSVSAQAILPPHFTDEMFDVTSGTRPSRIILKYFEPVDKGFKVEVDKLINSVYVVDFKDGRRTACWEYDTKGNLKEKYELVYNEHGNVSGVRKKDKNQNLQLREEYIYANPKDKNTLKEKRLYNSSDLNILGNEIYLRDKQGRVSAIRHLDANGKEKYSDNYTYNAEGLLETDIRLDATGSRRSETENTYDEDGRIILEVVSDRNGKILVQNKYTYNVKGLADHIATISANGASEYYTIEYTYDERGNWIQQIVYKGMGRVPEAILVRIISY